MGRLTPDRVLAATQSRDRQEVGGPDRVAVIGEEGPPPLGGRAPTGLAPVAANGLGTDLMAQHLQLASDADRAPTRVLPRQAEDEGAGLFRGSAVDRVVSRDSCGPNTGASPTAATAPPCRGARPAGTHASRTSVPRRAPRARDRRSSRGGGARTSPIGGAARDSRGAGHGVSAEAPDEPEEQAERSPHSSLPSVTGGSRRGCRGASSKRSAFCGPTGPSSSAAAKPPAGAE